MSVETGSNPFVGLRPFERDESLLFFGRQEQTLELLERLHQHHFVAVTGSSGSGKSSLIRAGLIPRLLAGYLVNDNDRWMVTVMKPGQTPLCNLAEAILAEPALGGQSLTATELEQKIREEGVEALLSVLQTLWKTKTNFFLLVDQFEELFRFSLHQQDLEKKDEAKDFVNILLALCAEKDLPIYVVLTMRSDFIGDCALIYGLPEAMNKSQYIVPRLNRLQLRIAIEGPVRLYGGTINPTLTARLLNDVQLINDELPLLQHALMRIWDYEVSVQKNGELDLDDYERIGGIEKALSNHADEAMTGMTAEEEHSTKRLFQALTTVDENGRKIRRPARLSELAAITGAKRETLLQLIDRFTKDKRFFLVSNKIPNSDDFIVDISHESLIRQWHRLSDWVDEEADARKTFLRLSETAERLTKAATLFNEKKGDYLQGLDLQIALQWYNSFRPDAAWARQYSEDYESTFRFLHESEAQWKAQQKEKERQQLQKRRNRRLLVAGLVAVILIISGFAYAIYRNNAANKRRLAFNYWSTSQSVREKSELLSSLHFTAEALLLSNEKELTKNLLADIEPFLPQTALQTVFSFPDYITSVAIHPDNKRIALAGNDGTVRIIDRETGTLTGPVMKHEAPVVSVAFSADGRWLLSGSNDSTARLWDLSSEKAILTLRHPAEVISAVFSPDGKELLTACADGAARLWETATGKQVAVLQHNAAVTDATFSPDGKWIVTASEDSTARLWDAAGKKQVALLPYRERLKVASFNRDGTRFLTAGYDSTVQVWDASARETILTVNTPSFVNKAAFSPDGNWIATAGMDGYIRLWDALTGRQVSATMKHQGDVFDLVFSADGKQLVTTGWDKAVRLWNVLPDSATGSAVVFAHPAPPTLAAFSSDGKRILTTCYDNTVRLWDVASQKPIFAWHLADDLTGATVSDDGRLVATTSRDGVLRLWDAGEGKLKDSFAVKTTVSSAAFSPDNKSIAVADERRIIYFLNTANMQLIDSFTYVAYINSLALSRNGKTILIAGADNTARLLDIQSKKILDSFKHQDAVTSAVFSPDEKTVLTASYDFTARLWNIATQQQIGPPLKHGAAVKSAVFSPDGNWIVTTSFDRASRLWDATTQKQLGVPNIAKDGVNSAVFSPDGTKVLTAGGDGFVRLWPIAGDWDIPAALFRLQAKALTGTELNPGTGEPQCLSLEQWKPLQKNFFEKGREHYRSCQYPAFNQWRRVYAEEAKTVR
jgi:WD40 repeat protein